MRGVLIGTAIGGYFIVALVGLLVGNGALVGAGLGGAVVVLLAACMRDPPDACVRCGETVPKGILRCPDCEYLFREGK